MYTKATNFPVPPSGIAASRRKQQGTTLIELLIAVGLATLVLVAIMAISLFSARSFAALVNYVDLDNFSRSALDEITSDIRQADGLVAGTEHTMVFRFTNPANSTLSYNVSYSYDPKVRTLSRTQGSTTKVLLEECDFLRFDFFQRNAHSGSFNLYETAPAPVIKPRLCKAVQMRWVCSREIMGLPVNTESVQSARVVVRKR